MNKRNRSAVRAAGVAAILVAVVAVVLLLDADSHVAGSVVARPIGWIAPLVTLLVVAGVGWILLGQRRPTDDSEPSFEHVRCPSCQREVLGQWRMCPYCGSMLERSAPASALGTGQADR